MAKDFPLFCGGYYNIKGLRYLPPNSGAPGGRWCGGTMDQGGTLLCIVRSSTFHELQISVGTAAVPDLNGERQISVGTAGLQPRPLRSGACGWGPACQKECQNRCQKECQHICQKVCQNRCQVECQKECQSICQKERQIECQNIPPVYTYL